MEILFMDVETTGTDPNDNMMIQLAAEFHRDGKLVSAFNKKFASAYGSGKISLGALKVNRQTIEQINKLASDGQEMFNFVDWLLSLKPKGQVTVCGHNVPFDISFVKQAFSNHNISGWGEYFSYRILDTSTIALFLQEAGVLKLDKLSLGNLVSYFNIQIPKDQLHDAGLDTTATALVYYELVKLVKELAVKSSL